MGLGLVPVDGEAARMYLTLQSPKTHEEQKGGSILKITVWLIRVLKEREEPEKERAI